MFSSKQRVIDDIALYVAIFGGIAGILIHYYWR